MEMEISMKKSPVTDSVRNLDQLNDPFLLPSTCWDALTGQFEHVVDSSDFYCIHCEVSNA